MFIRWILDKLIAFWQIQIHFICNQINFLWLLFLVTWFNLLINFVFCFNQFALNVLIWFILLRFSTFILLLVWWFNICIIRWTKFELFLLLRNKFKWSFYFNAKLWTVNNFKVVVGLILPRKHEFLIAHVWQQIILLQFMQSTHSVSDDDLLLAFYSSRFSIYYNWINHFLADRVTVRLWPTFVPRQYQLDLIKHQTTWMHLFEWW